MESFFLPTTISQDWRLLGIELYVVQIDSLQQSSHCLETWTKFASISINLIHLKANLLRVCAKMFAGIVRIAYMFQVALCLSLAMFAESHASNDPTERVLDTNGSVSRRRELRTIFCRCVADFETFYDGDRRVLKSYFQYDGALHTTAEKSERQSLRQKSSTNPRQGTTDAVLGPDGYFVVEGITVLPLDNDACIVSQTNSALRTFLELMFQPRSQGSGGRSSLRSFASLFQKRKNRALSRGNSEEHERFVKQDENHRDMQGWEERRKQKPGRENSGSNIREKAVKSILEMDLRAAVPSPPVSGNVKPRPQPQPSGFPRVFPCPPVVEDTSIVPSPAPSAEVDTSSPTSAPLIMKPSTAPSTFSPEPTVSPIPTVAPTSRLKISDMPTGAPSSFPTFTLFPSGPPSISPKPTVSQMPTNVETLDPTLSNAPTISLMPSDSPTISVFPTKSLMPSFSSAPNANEPFPPSDSPSVQDFIEPTISQKPSVSEPPSFVPSFSEAPSEVPLPVSSLSPAATSVPISPPIVNIVDTMERFRPRNNLCENSVSLKIDGSSLSGTTQLGTNEVDFGCDVAGGIQTSISPGVWFTAVGNGNIFEVSTCSERTNFGTAMQVLTGGCGNLKCLENGGRLFDRSCSKADSNEWSRFGTRVRIESVVDEVYSFLVLSRLGANAGDFDIHLDEIVTPANDRCDQAINFEVDKPKLHLGTTINATIGDNYGCGSRGGVSNVSPGLWYYTVGNGATYTTSTCTAWTTFDTAIQVFSGTCGQLTCLAGAMSDDKCLSGVASRVSFPTVAGEIYYIYVFGRLETDSGSFVLTLTSDTEEPGV
jgi:hypothetical protein